MNTKLYDLCNKNDFAVILLTKDYKWFDTDDKKKPYNLNIIGVRSNEFNNKVTNSFDDIMVVEYIDGRGQQHKDLFPITTEPGKYYMNNPLSKNGTAILKEGQYIGCWQLGRHKGIYPALVQCKPVTVYRDNNKNDVYDLDPNKTEKGLFGLNIHRSNPNVKSIFVDKWSAGCQVFSYYKDFNKFIALCNKQKELYGNSFTYTLLNENNLLWK